MSTISLTVVKSTPSKNGGHILKLQNKQSKTIATPFGQKTQSSQETYYMKVDAPQAVGFTATLDTDAYKVIERDFVITDPTSDLNGQTIQLKWLSI